MSEMISITSGMAALKQLEPACSPILDKGLLGKKILLVDDSCDIRAIYAAALMLNGAEIETASNGLECLEYLTTDRFDMIIMDIQMPKMDGLTACRYIRAQGITIPIIALTSYHSRVNYELCMSVGFDQRISKPIDPVALVHAIVDIIDCL